MALRHRLVLLATGTVAVTVLLAAVACYAVIRAEIRGQIDEALRTQGRAVQRITERLPVPLVGRRIPGRVDPGEGAGFVQVVGADGRVHARTTDGLALEPTARDREIARRGTGDVVLDDRRADGKHLRVATIPIRGGAVQLTRSLDSTDATLGRVRFALLALWLVASALAFAVTRLFARGLESSRTALAESVAAQRQLVADASHELRTPITSLRTNIEVLLEPDALPPEDRRPLLEDLRDQTEEIGGLIDDVIEAARGDHSIGPVEDVRLDVVVEEAVERARRLAPDVAFMLDARPTVVLGARDRLGRAVANLLDNAAKHSPPGACVSVTVRDGTLEVADRGPGVPDERKARVFDRFYSGGDGRPGYGLGLAIVKQTAAAHGGTVEVADGPAGGAVFRLRLPAMAAEPATESPRS
jgi:two-component system sensor histidine kinase MprB